MAEKYVDLSIREYLAALGSNAPAPGGGSSAALTGASGVSLLLMVINMTLGKEKYKEYEELCLEKKERCEELYTELLELVDADVAAYTLVSQAYKMPKETEEEKSARSAAIERASFEATKVPHEVMMLCGEAIAIAAELIGNSNPTVISDIGVAAESLRCAVKSSWLNVKINLPSIKENSSKEIFAAAEIMMSKAGELTDKIYARTLSTLR